MKCGSVKYTSRFEQGAKLPMSIIIVGVGQAEFDGKLYNHSCPYEVRLRFHK